MAKNTSNATNEQMPAQFKSYNRTNALGRLMGQGLCSISIGKNGSFLLSKELSGRMGLKVGMSVAFHHDPTQDEWYMEHDDKDGFVLRADTQGRLLFNSATLYKAMRSQFPDDAVSGQCLVAQEHTRIAGRALHSIMLSSIKPGTTRKR